MFKKPTKKDLKAASKAYKKLNSIPRTITGTEMYYADMEAQTRRLILNTDNMAFLGYKVDSWLALWNALRANYNEEDPAILAKHISIRFLK